MGVALLILGFIWGSSFILMKVALFDTQGQPLFPALDVAMGRIAIAGFALLPLAAIHRKHLNRNTLPGSFWSVASATCCLLIYSPPPKSTSPHPLQECSTH